MRFLLSLCMLVVTACSMLPAFAGTNAGEYAAEYNFSRGAGFQKYQLGKQIFENQVRTLKVQFDFSKRGGAIGAYQLDEPATPGFAGAPAGTATLPKNAVVVGCYIDVITPGATSASGTVAISTGQGAGDLKVAAGAATYTAGILACVPVGTAATAIKLTADSKPTATIAVGAITALKMNVIIQYVLSDP